MDSDSDLIEQQMSGLDYDLEVHQVGSEGEAIEAMKGADIVINAGVPLPREVIEEIDQASAIVSMGHGFNHIDHDAATDQGIMVVNSAGFCTEEVSNHAILMLMACAKKLTLLNELVKAGKWGAETRQAILPMVPIDGQTLGLVALGNIGRAVARKAKVFGLNVIAYDPYVAPWIAKEYQVRLVPSLDALARESDFVSVHSPLNNETRGLLGESFFKAMKPTAFVINTCRGPVIDEAAMIRALDAGEIAGAGLDVFEEEPTSPNNPLFKMDNVIVTPHSAGTSDRSRVASQVQIGQETARLLRGTFPMSVVNPEVRHKIEGRPVALNS
jgi:D-3-phosphoglycerate dehydrogenase|tara:strand:- start:142 stop:1125 length:984 start_codon:yes stop_codon:yes gene_type:complete